MSLQNGIFEDVRHPMWMISNGVTHCDGQEDMVHMMPLLKAIW